MCGIFGVIGKRRLNDHILLDSCDYYLGNRGPDGINLYKQKDSFICHSRLAINDLSRNGIQPFKDKTGSIYSITNGEIYNDKELRRIKNLEIKTTNDCAIIPELFKEDGIKSLSKLNGMFAIAIIDNDNQELIICRDSDGIKPLYYIEGEDFIAFSSSNQQLAKLFNEYDLDSLSLNLFLVLKYIPAPMSGFLKIKKLLPGEIRSFSLGGKFLYSTRITKKNYILEANNYSNIRSLIHNSVKDHLNSDVKIYSLLSGGLDSSIITFEAKQLIGDIETFTAFQGEPIEDLDVIHSSILCKHLDIKQNLIKIPNLDFEDIYSPLKQLSEPSADPAYITGYYLMKQIKSKKVFLSGDGADELFGGYGISEKFEKRFIRSNILNLLIEILMDKDRELIPNLFYKNKFTRTVLKNLDSSINEQLLFLSLYSGLPISILKLILPQEIFKIINMPDSNYPQIIQQYELEELMPNYFLAKVDSMSMLNSVEIRNPFISGIVRKYSQSFVNKNYSSKKGLLINAYKNYLPKEIINRKKIGFTRNLNIFKDNKKWMHFSSQIPTELFYSLNVPIQELLRFSKNKSIEASEIRWRIFSLISWLSGNQLIKDIKF